MLEEALSSTTHSPAEAALTFISFLEVELAAGGAAAESRFFKLFSLLCDRVFGEISKEEAFRHKIGGWLARHVRWERPNVAMAQSKATHIIDPHRSTPNSSSVKSDPVVKLLGASAATASLPANQQRPLTLIEAFAKEAEHRPNVRYPFPFQAFPKSTQDAWLALIDAALSGTPPSEKFISENSRRLLGSLFRVKPLEQINLRYHQQQKAQERDSRRPLQLSPMQFQSRQPLSPAAVQATSPSKQEAEAPPMISLSMLEYYLVVFIRYPLAPPPSQSPPVTKTVRSGVPVPSSRRAEPYGDTVYYQLFQEYTDYYVPNTIPQGQSNGFAPLQRPSELFLRTVVELWLEGQNSLMPTDKAVKAIQERQPQCSTDLNASFDLVRTKYEPPPPQITRCLHRVIARAVSDGALLDMARDMHAGFKGAQPEVLCLTPAMTILQQPFFNYIRCTFRHASIHTKQSPFYSALEDWLVWLEPWNTRHSKPRSQGHGIMGSVSRSQVETAPTSKITTPKANQASMYKDCWEPYIAANLHLYTVPLAIFLRRSRELDFSPREYQRSLHTVRRVLRVFSPQVVSVINSLLNKEDNSKWKFVVARHETNMGPYTPPTHVRGLTSCQDDMQSLLEEMYLQHMKKVEGMDFIDRSIAYIEGFFGGGAVSGEEKELRVVAKAAKATVGFPEDFDVIPSIGSTSADAQFRSFDPAADRASNGFLSKAGVERISTGAAKCDPLEIGYVGDRMHSRPGSHEVAWLIPLLVGLSTFLNERLRLQDGVTSNSNSILPQRINLRFFADKRNLLFTFLFLWVLKKTTFG
eukprot:CAMPEP_0176035338 /NCGR_PEP_ID=MMETSP0120_2-20121206/17476_1 /TAXON_ID=160619 /ORGANISM="Kryptoperidinium foliaceum, Strain CCMP 1326" /LENGTH=806 /DNA_ID=CAMNT_0017368685 /DNA_START=106 /DNA_END=2527 /DNA_ORIENTATION=+